jgi:hypothetical protein
VSALPRWKCHKVVEAAKITGLTFPTPDDAALHFRDASSEPVDARWISRNLPDGSPDPFAIVGGYFVRYEDGYTSWSPADAFEKGYRRVDDDGSNLVRYAEEELRRAGLADADADYGGAIAESVLALVRTFAEQGHSGESAARTIEVFGRVARFRPLTPLTSNPDEWMDVSEHSDRPTWQSKRSPSVFSHDGGKTWHDLDAPALGSR